MNELRFEKVYDISVTLGTEAPHFPGDPPFALEAVSSVAKGDPYTLHRVSFGTHAGTHLDLPAHFIPRERGQTVEKFPPHKFIFPAQVVEILDEMDRLAAYIKSIKVPPGMALLFKTVNSRTGIAAKPTFSDTFVAMPPDAAEACCKKRVALVGWDYATVEVSQDNSFPVHWALLESNIFLLEGITLAHVPAGSYTLICPPIKIGGAEAAPTRAFLVKE